MEIPTCSALYRKIFARTGSGERSWRPAAGSTGDTVPAQCTGTCPFLQAHSTKSTHRSRLSALTMRTARLNWGLGRSLSAFLLLKVFKNKQMPWYDRAPCAQSWSSRVPLGSRGQQHCQHTDPEPWASCKHCCLSQCQMFCSSECSGWHSALSQTSSNFESLITFIQAVRFKGWVN